MDTLFERIEEYNKGLSPAKIIRKYKLLKEDPFRFFRGTNHLFYEDFSKASLPAAPSCWICGDLHLENFGTYKADNGLVYFDLNDFDEAILAPVSWELTRMLTSILIAFDSLKITEGEAIGACKIFLKKYTNVLAEGKPRYIDARTTTGILKKFIRNVETRSQETLLSGRTFFKNGKLHLNHHHDKLLKIDKGSRTMLLEKFATWMDSNNQPPNNYKILDINFRLAGTGSLGISRYVFLLEKIACPGKYMMVDMKQAMPSSLAKYISVKQPAWESEAQRIITIQRLMQNIPPAQLSTLDIEGKSYIMAELQPTKDRINFKIIQNNFRQVCSVIEDMALLTASAHLRSVGRLDSCTADELIKFGEDNSWQEVLINYATRYKTKVNADFAAFKKQYKAVKNRHHNSVNAA